MGLRRHIKGLSGAGGRGGTITREKGKEKSEKRGKEKKGESGMNDEKIKMSADFPSDSILDTYFPSFIRSFSALVCSLIIGNYSFNYANCPAPVFRCLCALALLSIFVFFFSLLFTKYFRIFSFISLLCAICSLVISVLSFFLHYFSFVEGWQ